MTKEKKNHAVTVVEIAATDNPDAQNSFQSLRGRIALIAKQGKELDTEIHAVAIGCLKHFELYGNTTLCTELFLAMPRSGRAQALKTWFLTFAPLKFNKEENKFLKDTKKTANKFNLKEATDVPFWDLTEEKAVKAVSIDTIMKVIQANLGKLEKAAKGEGDKPLDEGLTPEEALKFVAHARKALFMPEEQQAA